MPEPKYPLGDPRWLTAADYASPEYSPLGLAAKYEERVWDKSPEMFQGEIRNLPERPYDRFEQAQAEALSPTMGAYGLGQLAGETALAASEGDWAKSLETGLPLLGIFAGPGARTADMSMLAKAQRLAQKGASRETIWDQTGWFQGPDQKWRFEIPDNEAAYVAPSHQGGRSYEANLPDVLGHDKLYAAYPNLERTQAEWGYGARFPTTRGAYDPPDLLGRDAILAEARSRKEFLPTMMHEVQHAVSEVEGFPRGTSPDRMFLYRESASREFDRSLLRLESLRGQRDAAVQREDGVAAAQIAEEIRATEKEADRLVQILQATDYDLYKRTAGEVEAQATQDRCGDRPIKAARVRRGRHDPE